MSSNILPFAAASSGSSMFLAILGDPEGGFLSPRVMAWNLDIHCYVIDLTPTLRYWQQQATERNLTLEELLATLLPSMTVGVLAPHPWLAVLHLKTLSARGNHQLINLQSAFGRNLSNDLSWDSWWQTCREIATHWQAWGRNSDTLVRNLRSMEQTVQRMQVDSPAHFFEKHKTSRRKEIGKDKKQHSRGPEFTPVNEDLSQGSDEVFANSLQQLSNQMQRRFGVLLSTLWHWTWNNEHVATKEGVTKDDFPWRIIKCKEMPQVQRLLEHPLRDWDHIEPLLCEDLDRICNLKCWSASERVVSLEWMLSFSNSPTLTIPVLFRHPHCLHREATHHKTALLQAFYSWQSVLEKRLKQSRFKADSEYLDNDAVTEWTLRVRERLIIPPHARSLFMDDLNSPSQRLRELENTLPCPLQRFDLKADWTPEESWSSLDNESSLHFESLSLASFEAQHLRRPLFIYEKPTPLTSRRSSGLFFQERVMRKWWEFPAPGQESSINDTVRDYYLRCEDDGVLQWTYSDQNGKLFLHGVYG